MALETATHINGLNSSNPVSTDAISASDDHLRLIKATLLATFPNIAGAMNASHTELNTVADGDTAATSTTLASADRIVVNDDGTMVQVSLSDLLTYLNSFQTAAGALATINSSGNAVTLSGLTYPSADGSADQFLKTNGSGTLSFGTPTGTFSMPAGMIFPYAGSSAPTGYLICDGAAISRTTYADLFTAIATTYGTGDGSSTFNLPDLRGRTIAGKGTGSTIASSLFDASGTQDTLGATVGADDVALTEANLASHTHTVNSVTIGTLAPNTTGQNTPNSGGILGTALDINNGNLSTSTSSFINGIGTNSHTASLANTGSGTAHNNMQPTIILNYLIKT